MNRVDRLSLRDKMGNAVLFLPTNELVGYCRRSLRDEDLSLMRMLLSLGRWAVEPSLLVSLPIQEEHPRKIVDTATAAR
jgi:hypothetical protein